MSMAPELVASRLAGRCRALVKSTTMKSTQPTPNRLRNPPSIDSQRRSVPISDR
jgi:hypothetical protein